MAYIKMYTGKSPYDYSGLDPFFMRKSIVSSHRFNVVQYRPIDRFILINTFVCDEYVKYDFNVGFEVINVVECQVTVRNVNLFTSDRYKYVCAKYVTRHLDTLLQPFFRPNTSVFVDEIPVTISHDRAHALVSEFKVLQDLALIRIPNNKTIGFWQV